MTEADPDWTILDDDVVGERYTGALNRQPSGSRHLFIAAGGGGDVLAASIVQRMLYSGPVPHVVTYSWDRLLVDPLPGPRGPSCFDGIQAMGDHNFLVTADSTVRGIGHSLLPRLANELGTRFYLLDPYRGARGMRAQLAELVRLLDIERVSLVDSGGDILATGGEAELRSPLADALALAATDGIGAPVDILVTGTGLDGELAPEYVRSVVGALGGQLDRHQVQACHVGGFRPILRWHPSEVNGLLISAAMGYRGTVEIRDAGLRVEVDWASAAVHRCAHSAAIARNALAKSLIGSTSLDEVEDVLTTSAGRSEIVYQRENAKRYGGAPPSESELRRRLDVLLDYGRAHASVVDALTLRRVAEILGIDNEQLRSAGPWLEATFPEHFDPPLWRLR